MKITVFGATGHVGKHVVNQGLALGYQIVAFGRNIDKLIDRDIAADALETIKGYVFEPGMYCRLFKVPTPSYPYWADRSTGWIKPGHSA